MKIPTPQEIEAAAIKLGKPMGQVCREARVAHNTFSRWKHLKLAINTDTLQRLIDIVEPEAK
jgi:hypothetical protein